MTAGVAANETVQQAVVLTAAQQQLVTDTMGMVRGIAKLRHASARSIPVEDFVAVGNAVLVEMVLYYRPEEGAFDKFTSVRVWGAMVDLCRKTFKGWRLQKHAAGLALESPAELEVEDIGSPTCEGERRVVVDSLDAAVFGGIVSYMGAPLPTPEEAVISKSRLQRVREVIQRYLAEQPARGQAIFRAYHYEEQTIASIAAREGISRATVERALQQHRSQLRDLCIKYAQL